MSVTVELPNQEFANDFVNMVDGIIALRHKEKEEAIKVKEQNEKVRDNAQLAISQQETVIAEKEAYIVALNDLKEQAQGN